MKRFITRLHLWTGLLLGAQIFLWMLSGVIMSWFHIDKVRGTHNRAEPAPIVLNAMTNWYPVGDLMTHERAIKSLSLTQVLNQPAYKAVYIDGTIALFDGQTGTLLDRLSETQARKVALMDFTGSAEIETARFLSEAPREYAGPLPVWQINFADSERTRLYISPQDGRVVSRRNKTWRLYDFFWMLHIMDYEERHDFNNPLIKTASVTGLIFTMSGIGLVFMRLRNRRYKNDLILLKRKIT